MYKSASSVHGYLMRSAGQELATPLPGLPARSAGQELALSVPVYPVSSVGLESARSDLSFPTRRFGLQSATSDLGYQVGSTISLPGFPMMSAGQELGPVRTISQDSGPGFPVRTVGQELSRSLPVKSVGQESGPGLPVSSAGGEFRVEREELEGGTALSSSARSHHSDEFTLGSSIISYTERWRTMRGKSPSSGKSAEKKTGVRGVATSSKTETGERKADAHLHTLRVTPGERKKQHRPSRIPRPVRGGDGRDKNLASTPSDSSTSGSRPSSASVRHSRKTGPARKLQTEPVSLASSSLREKKPPPALSMSKTEKTDESPPSTEASSFPLSTTNRVPGNTEAAAPASDDTNKSSDSLIEDLLLLIDSVPQMPLLDNSEVFELIATHPTAKRKWSLLARYLGMSEENIQEIKRSYHFNEEKCLRMLLRWSQDKKTSTSSATYARLLCGLINIREYVLARGAKEAIPRCAFDRELRYSMHIVRLPLTETSLDQVAEEMSGESQGGMTGADITIQSDPNDKLSEALEFRLTSLDSGGWRVLEYMLKAAAFDGVKEIVLTLLYLNS